MTDLSLSLSLPCCVRLLVCFQLSTDDDDDGMSAMKYRVSPEMHSIVNETGESMVMMTTTTTEKQKTGRRKRKGYPCHNI